MTEYLTDSEASILMASMENLNNECLSGILQAKKISDTHMDWIINTAVVIPHLFIKMMANRPELTDSHVDTILSQGFWERAVDIFELRHTLTPRQIRFGLRHVYPIVYEAAYNHPCCTEEQKVWYHLTKGDTA